MHGHHVADSRKRPLDVPESEPSHFSNDAKAGSTTSNMSHTQENWTPSKQQWAVIAGQSCCVFVVSLDATIFSASLPTVATALHANGVTAYWVITAYLLASAVVQPLTAVLADVFGRRSTFLASLTVFTIGTILCCTAHSSAQMLIGRTVQGLGGGGISSVNLIILSDLIPLRHRSKYVGIVQVINAVAIAFGPVIGAALINTTWRWLFYINFPFLAIGLAVTPFLLRYVEAQKSFYDKLSSIDWIGCGTFVVGATIFLLGLSWGGLQFSWSSVATLVPLILGIVVVCATVGYEAYAAPLPFLRLSVFGSSSAIAAYLCTVLVSLTLFVELYFIVLYLMAVKLYTPIISSVVFLGLAGTVAPVSGVTGGLITKLGGYRWAIFSGWLINTFAIGALMILDERSFLPGLIFLFVVAGIGQGMLFIGHQVACQASAPVKDVAYASAMFSFCRSLGFSLGVALGGTIFQNMLQRQLADMGLPASIAHDATGFAATLRHVAAGPERDAIVQAYTYAFRYLFATMTGISGLGFAISFVIKEYNLNVTEDGTHHFKFNQTGESQPSSEMMARRRPSVVA